MNFVLRRGVSPGDRRTSSENELVSPSEARDDQERIPKSKIWNNLQRGSELKKPELKFK